MFREDLTTCHRAYCRDLGWFGAWFQLLREPGILALAAYRLGHWLIGRGVLLKLAFFPAYLILADLGRILWGIEIGRFARIGRRFRIRHFGGIVIGDWVVIGDDCVVHQGVTIGASRGHGQRDGVPQLGDHVFVGAGAKLIGCVKIGDHAVIGANAVIHKDIPAGAVAVCSPGFTIIRAAGGSDSEPEP